MRGGAGATPPHASGTDNAREKNKNQITSAPSHSATPKNSNAPCRTRKNVGTYARNLRQPTREEKEREKKTKTKTNEQTNNNNNLGATIGPNLPPTVGRNL